MHRVYIRGVKEKVNFEYIYLKLSIKFTDNLFKTRHEEAQG